MRTLWNAALLAGLACALALGADEAPPPAGGGGTVRGTVSVAGSGATMAHASVMLSPGGRTASTSEKGQYVFRDVAPGSYSVLAHMHALSDDRRTINPILHNGWKIIL